MGKELSVTQLKEAIRLAESAGDNTTAEELKKKLQNMSINS